MKAIQAYPQQGLDGLTLMNLPALGDPGPNAMRVRVHATCLNFHDLGVMTGRLPAADGRIPMPRGPGWSRRSARKSRRSGPATIACPPSFQPG